jgi:hypothetical protein
MIIYFAVFITLICNNIVEIEFYAFCAFISGILLLLDISFIAKRDKWIINPFFYVDIYLFFTAVISPIFQFHFYTTDSWFEYLTDIPSDWTPYANIVAGLYLVGIIIWLVVKDCLNRKRSNEKSLNRIWRIPSYRIKYIYILLFISFVLQTYIYISLGGITGYIQIYSEGGFSGYGFLFVFSEIFPLLLILLYFIKAKESAYFHKWSIIYLFLAALFFTCLYFGGLRGSRSNTLYTLVHAIFLIHLCFRKFSKTQLLVICALCYSFLYIGKIYKNTRGQIFTDKYYTISEGVESGKGKNAVVGNFSKYSFQVYLIYKYEKSDYYTPKLGSTYVGDVLNFIPFYEPENPIHKTAALSELLHGKDHRVQERRSSYVGGLLGETIINFGWIFSPLIFILFTYVIHIIKSKCLALSFDDVRFFLIPLFINLSLIMFNSDLDNVLFFIIKRIIPFLLIISFLKREEIVNLKPYCLNK